MFLENLDDFVRFRLLTFVRSKGIIFAVIFECFVLLFFFSRSRATRRVAPRRNGLRKLKRSRKWTTHVVTITRCTYGDCCVGIVKVQSPMTIITNIGRSVSNSVASPYSTQRLFIIVLIHVRRSRDRKFVIILINTAKYTSVISGQIFWYEAVHGTGMSRMVIKEIHRRRDILPVRTHK